MIEEGECEEFCLVGFLLGGRKGDGLVHGYNGICFVPGIFYMILF